VRPRVVGERVPRVGDRRLLAGRARFVDDVSAPGMLHAAIVRSPLAHGVVRAHRGFTLGPDEIRAATRPVPVLWTVGVQRQTHTVLGDAHLRYVGQPIGVVVGESRAAAEDLAEAVEIDVDDRPVVADVAAALAPGASLLYPELGTNVLCEFESGDPEDHTAAVFAAAHRTLRTRLHIGRVHGIPMECRGIVAVPDPATDHLTIWSSNQAPHAIRDVVAEVLGRPQHRIRVIAPDVGGGFGLKDHVYDDELMVVLAAVRLGRPVKWIEDRFEHLVSTTHARDDHVDVEVAYDDDGRLRGLRLTADRDTGAHFAIFGGGPLFVMAGMVPGAYRWDAVRTVGRVVATNRTPLGAYRGFGQTQAVLVVERAVDLVARALGRDPVELRLQNMIGATDLPYTTRTGITYDNGDYPAALRRARELAAAWPAAPSDGRVRGTGVASYVQMAGIGPSAANQAIGLAIGGYETATVRIEPDATVRIATGISPHGQGQETTFAQLAADALGVRVADVELMGSDTDVSPYSAYGTAASRSIAVGGGALVLAVDRLAHRLRLIAAELLEAAPADVELADGRAGVVGTQVSVPLAEVARRAWQGFGLPEGLAPGLIETAAYDPVSATFSYATHVCRVAVDRSTGLVEVERYGVVHDCGTIVNPQIVEGQIIGGIAQGLGAALLEEVVYGDDGQPLATTFLDYLAPVESSVPDVEIVHVEIPSPYTPGGMKGMGEGGTNGAMACVVNALVDALPEIADRLDRTPLTPSRLWELLQSPVPPPPVPPAPAQENR
jgi:aerobic carbon-monoxide dehydrogenase large subunit